MRKTNFLFTSVLFVGLVLSSPNEVIASAYGQEATCTGAYGQTVNCDSDEKSDEVVYKENVEIVDTALDTTSALAVIALMGSGVGALILKRHIA